GKGRGVGNGERTLDRRDAAGVADFDGVGCVTVADQIDRHAGGGQGVDRGPARARLDGDGISIRVRILDGDRRQPRDAAVARPADRDRVQVDGAGGAVGGVVYVDRGKQESWVGDRERTMDRLNTGGVAHV